MKTYEEEQMSESTVAQAIELENLKPSKTNPRRSFDGEAMKELVDSVRKHGILQPVLVRPLNGAFEIVAGERRFRAAKEAGLKQVPAVVRAINDQEALEIQVVENLQRSDLHPLEEAEGYRLLHKKHGYSVDDLAAKVGKSKAYVYARLKLCVLGKKGKEAFLAGKLSPSVALLVARVPEALQDQVMEDVLNRDSYRGCDEPMSYREAFDHIQRRYMLQLAEAPFDPKDPRIHPKAGPCTTCPKRTGNQPMLFPDIKGADVCTDPVCFETKVKSWATTRMAEAEASGRKVLEVKDVERVSGYSGQHIKLDDRCYDDPKQRNYRTLLWNHLKPDQIVLAHDTTRQRVYELVPKPLASELLKKAGHSWAKTAAGRDSTGVSDYRKRELEAKKLDRAVEDACLAQVIKAAEKEGITHVLIRHLSKCAAAAATHELKMSFCRRRGLEPVIKKHRDWTHRDWDAPIFDLIEKATAEQLAGILVEMVGFGRYGPPQLGKPSQYPGDRFDDSEETCKHYGVDTKSIRKKLAAEMAMKKPRAKKETKKEGK